MKKHIAWTAFSLLGATQALALDQIIHPAASARSAGMGGVWMTTGLYDQNFFGNPARVTANPRTRISLLEPSGEFNSTFLPNMSNILNNTTPTGLMGALASSAGQNIHARIQTTMPGVYFSGGGDDPKLFFGFAVLTSTQIDIDMRRSYNISPQVISDIGPAVTIGHKFLEKNALSIGMTPHMTYRLSSSSVYSVTDLMKGTSITDGAGMGGHFDIDLGGTYDLPVEWLGMKWTAGAAFNNLLGGNYSMIPSPVSSIAATPTGQPRTFGFGASASVSEWQFLKNIVLALDVQDIGNSGGGSAFRLIHLGGEAHYGVLAARLGINQGYLSAGIGIDTRVVHLDLATYGEEMTLNAGGMEDRRIAFSLGLHI